MKIYLTDEDKMMRDPNIKWTSSSIITKDSSKRTDEFLHCRCCKDVIYKRSTSDKRYCLTCAGED